MNRLIFLLGAFVLVLAVFLWVVWPSHKPAPAGVVQRQVSPEPRDVVLYFSDPAGFALVSEERQMAGCNDARQCIAQTLEALALGSKLLVPVLPERTRILGVVVEDDLATINFSRDLVNRHPGGSFSELLTVYGLTNTLMVNFPNLRRLQILVEGQVEPTLKGHVDISRPIKAEFRYSRLPQARDRQVSAASDEPEVGVPKD